MFRAFIGFLLGIAVAFGVTPAPAAPGPEPVQHVSAYEPIVMSGTCDDVVIAVAGQDAYDVARYLAGALEGC